MDDAASKKESIRPLMPEAHIHLPSPFLPSVLLHSSYSAQLSSSFRPTKKDQSRRKKVLDQLTFPEDQINRHGEDEKGHEAEHDADLVPDGRGRMVWNLGALVASHF